MELTVQDIADLEGWKTTGNIRRAINSGYLKARRVGKRLWLIEESEYKRWKVNKLGMQAQKKKELPIDA